MAPSPGGSDAFEVRDVRKSETGLFGLTCIDINDASDTLPPIYGPSRTGKQRSSVRRSSDRQQGQQANGGQRSRQPGALPAGERPDSRNFAGKQLEDLVKVPFLDLDDTVRLKQTIKSLLVDSLEEDKAQALLLIRSAARHNPRFIMDMELLEDLKGHLLSRNRLLRPCAASALAALASHRLGRDILVRDRALLPRFIKMMRCGVDSMDAQYASLVLANCALHPLTKEFIGAAGAIPVLCTLIRQVVSAPLPVDENNNVNPFQLPGIKAHRTVQRLVTPKPAAINAASCLLNLADHPPNRSRMLAAGMPQVVTEVLTSRHPNILVERCQLLANWMNIGSLQALERRSMSGTADDYTTKLSRRWLSIARKSAKNQEELHIPGVPSDYARELLLGNTS